MIGESGLRFTHSGRRYILGFGADFYGIWDRDTLGGPILRFLRTDAGWTEAWTRFWSMEPQAEEVPTVPAPITVAKPLRPYRAATPWATAAIVMLGLTAVLSVASLAVHMRYLSLALRAMAHHRVSLREAENRQNLSDLMAGYDWVVIFPVAVAWLAWQFRAHANLRSLGVAGLVYSPAWAVGTWFVPLADMVMPFLIMRELWKASEPGQSGAAWKLVPTTSLLGLWWGWFLAMQVLFVAGADVGGSGTVLPPRQAAVRASLFVLQAIATTIAALLALVLVRRIEDREARAHTSAP